MGALRIAFVQAPSTDGWQGPDHAFQQAARCLSRSGHEVLAIDASQLSRRDIPPLLTAQNRSTATRHMLASHRLAMYLAENPPDLVIARLRGGIAQAPLMARACSEAFSTTRFALWSDTPSRDLFIGGDRLTNDLSPIIADALERQCLSMADCLVIGESSSLPLSVREFATDLPHVPCPRIPRLSSPLPIAAVDEIVFVGTFLRSSGAPEFIEAIERLEKRGELGQRVVSFVGPIDDSRYGLSKEWLGQRAAQWSFRFRAVAESSRAAALDYASRAGRLAVAISSDDEELDALRAACPHHVAYRASPMTDRDIVPGLVAALSQALQRTDTTAVQATEIDWNALLQTILEQPIRAPKSSPASVSVCVLHYDRLALLERALSSIPEEIDGKDVEIIVIDNATPMAGMKDRIKAVAGRHRRLRVLELTERVPQPAAYNLGLASANGDVVAFLDDDNFYVRDGLARLATAATSHDIVVTNLDVFEGHDRAPSSGRLIFLGQAHSAGLFYNFFGDTAMAVRRAAFVSEGCFHELSSGYSCLDWVSLAKAQGRGLRIGVLQWPAIRYRRDTARADVQAVKLDQAGARALVFSAYRGRFDAELVARYAQCLELDDL